MKRLALLFLLALAGCNESKPSPVATVGFAMIGDSIINLMAPLQPSMPAPFNTAVNFGVVGNSSGQILERLRSLPTAQILLLEGGINDLNNLTQLTANYMAILNLVPPTTKIIFVGIFRIDAALYPTITNAQIAQAQYLLNSICVQHPNCHPAVDAQNQDMTGLSDGSGIHPSAAGYVVLVNHLLKYI